MFAESVQKYHMFIHVSRSKSQRLAAFLAPKHGNMINKNEQEEHGQIPSLSFKPINDIYRMYEKKHGFETTVIH